jgi:dihydroorotate dehydrogenase electron transfer subunit
MNDESLLENVQVAVVNTYPGGYVSIRMAPPTCAPRLQPGHALELNGHRWPVMRVTPGWVEVMRRRIEPPVAGTGVRLRGPVGVAFNLGRATPRALLLGETDGIAPVIFLADVLRQRRPRIKLLVLLSSAQPWPFRPQPSRIVIPGLPGWVIAAVPLLDDWGVPSRLASPHEAPGCFAGRLDELAHGWLEVSQGVADVTVYACGTEIFLDGARRIAAVYHLPCQTVPPADGAD